jgi:hypothetical protein
MNDDERDLESGSYKKDPFLTGRRNRDELVEEMRIRLATRPLHGTLPAAGLLFPMALIYIVAIVALAAVALYLAVG